MLSDVDEPCNGQWVDDTFFSLAYCQNKLNLLLLRDIYLYIYEQIYKFTNLQFYNLQNYKFTLWHTDSYATPFQFCLPGSLLQPKHWAIQY